MMSWLTISTIAATLLTLLSCRVEAQSANRQALQAACFPPTALQSTTDEKYIRRASVRSIRMPVLTAEDDGPAAAISGAVRRVTLSAGAPKLVALTLDFCEQAHEIAGYDGAIIDLLRRDRVPATLFMSGKWMLTHDTRAKQMLTDPLFELAAHGWVHRNVRALTGETLRQEMLGPQAAYRTVRSALAQSQCAAPFASAIATSIPARLQLTRFPFGACSADSLLQAQRSGLTAVQWDVSTGDPSPATSARDIVSTITRQVRPGSIILAHANGRGHHTAEALPLAVKALRERGFVFVTVSELLAAGKPEIVPTCYDRVPGDTERYDRLFAR